MILSELNNNIKYDLIQIKNVVLRITTNISMPELRTKLHIVRITPPYITPTGITYLKKKYA